MAQQVALVTGASSGLGAEFARQLAADGMNLVLVARRRELLESLRDEIMKAHGVDCRTTAMDLGRVEAAEELFRQTGEAGLEVDWLVNNAGFGTSGPFATLPLDKEREEILLNIYTLVALTRLYVPGMIERGHGRIINLGSVGSFVPTPYMATYSATKAFVLSFSEALASELAGKGVTVLALCPGATKTEFQQVAGVDDKVPEMSYMTAEAVVRQAIDAAKAGRRSLVPGMMNKIMTASTRVTPRSVLAGIAGKMFAPKGS